MALDIIFEIDLLDKDGQQFKLLLLVTLPDRWGSTGSWGKVQMFMQLPLLMVDYNTEQPN